MIRSVVGLAFIVLSASAFGAIRSVTPTARLEQQNKWWMDRHLGKLAAVSNGEGRVVFIGDELVSQWEGYGCNQWNRLFKGEPYRALNLGMSADRTEHVLWRIAHGALDGFEAKAVVLEVGMNNVGYGKTGDESAIDIVIGIDAVLSAIRAKQPKAKVILHPILPRGREADNPFRRLSGVVNREIAKFADNRTVFWCDFSDQLMTADGRIPAEIMPDFQHLRSVGYEIWASAVIPFLNMALKGDDGLPQPSRYAAHRNALDDRMEPLPFAAAARSSIRDPANWWGKDKDMWFHALQRDADEIRAGKGAFDVVLLGDSITAGWDGRGKEELAALRKTYKTLNLGLGGDRTEQVLWRIRNGQLDGYRAKVVVLMIGTNNSHTDKPEDTALGVKLILETIRAKQPQAKVILCAVLPRGADPSDKLRQRNDGLNRIIRDYADGRDVVWLDFGAQMLDEKGDTLWIMPDRLHPLDKGYRIWSEAMCPLLGRFCAK